MSANDTQIGGDHYQTGDVQHWDWAKDMPYLEGRATAYIGRHQDKNGITDIEKGLHFIQKIIEERYGLKMGWHIQSYEEAMAEQSLKGISAEELQKYNTLIPTRER
jgi:hypothetical protein